MSKETNDGGIGCVTVLGMLFVVLKLTGVIHWSWCWVTLPFWGGFAFFIAFLFVAFVVMAIAEVWK